MQILKRGDIVLLPARVTGFSTDAETINVETVHMRTMIWAVPVDSVTVGAFDFAVGDRVRYRVSEMEVDNATVLGSTDREVWVKPYYADKSITISRAAVERRLSDAAPEQPTEFGGAVHG